MRWQSMKTAPKDGTPVILADEGKIYGLTLPIIPILGIWVYSPVYKNGGYWGAVGEGDVSNPIGWIPLPEAPQLKRKD